MQLDQVCSLAFEFAGFVKHQSGLDSLSFALVLQADHAHDEGSRAQREAAVANPPIVALPLDDHVENSIFRVV